ncbi:tRNA (adenosine(37)-N6)-dimethylallyltransferase MiaA [Candidatus Saccharibacteria bacterium]|nr:tRNA (adenosine(37)-N6)-dimethylallyltransferase MiaA [Candidatus Saccharibacteria bacterium]
MNEKVIVIVGPTGSGKTGVAVEIAKEIGGEVISADSRTIYKGMDVGTAKPSIEERGGVPHFGFDLVEPGERFTVKDWKDYTEIIIKEIVRRGHIPVVVGGTGLYIDALVYDYKFEVKAKGYGKNRGESIKNLNGKTGSLSNSDLNKYPDRQKICSKYKIFGIKWEREELKKRLEKRSKKMFCEELYDETSRLVKRYGWSNLAMTGNIYRIAWKVLCGEISEGEAIRENVKLDYQLSKRQMTWFKRNKNILWDNLDNIKADVIKCIQNEQGK